MKAITLPAHLLEALRAQAATVACAGERDRLDSLEWLLTSPRAFGLTGATPVQRAICRILDGTPLGELEKDPDVEAVLGGREAVEWLRANPHQTLELCVVAGIRGGKSLIAAAMAVRASQTCDVTRLGPGEVPRVSVVSLKLDVAQVVFAEHLIGRVMAAPALKGLIVGTPTADSIKLRHPSGRAVEIKVVAGSRAGGGLVARWSAGVIFDEATRMIGAEDGVVNLDDARHAVIGRLLPGAQAIYIGSAWAPFGPVYDMVRDHWGNPRRDLIVVRAKGWQMNPVHWNPEFRSKMSANSPIAYRTDGESEFVDPESHLYAERDLLRATRAQTGDLPYNPLWSYSAGMDPAGSGGNAWTLVITTHDGERPRVALTREWVAKDHETVLAELSELLRRYGLRTIRSDQWSADALKALARRYGITIDAVHMTQRDKFDAYEGLRLLLESASPGIELNDDPRLRDDLKHVRKQVTQDGYRIVLPLTPDGRHCDFAPALVLTLLNRIAAPRVQEPIQGSPEWHMREQERWRDNAVKQIQKNRRKESRSALIQRLANR